MSTLRIIEHFIAPVSLRNAITVMSYYYLDTHVSEELINTTYTLALNGEGKYVFTITFNANDTVPIVYTYSENTLDEIITEVINDSQLFPSLAVDENSEMYDEYTDDDAEYYDDIEYVLDNVQCSIAVAAA